MARSAHAEFRSRDPLLTKLRTPQLETTLQFLFSDTVSPATRGNTMAKQDKQLGIFVVASLVQFGGSIPQPPLARGSEKHPHIQLTITAKQEFFVCS